MGRSLAEEATWGRFTLVDSRGEADVVIELGEGGTGVAAALPLYGGGALAVEASAFTLVVRERDTRDVLWTDKETVTWSNKGSLKQLVKRLRTRLDRGARK